ncbi:hypothetical protein CBM2606_A10140 [Cupriavidus taiwanensis]|nr:hypothetical protein CBM2606_A10140 [Cupriavidus taiwanensis]
MRVHACYLGKPSQWKTMRTLETERQNLQL